MNFALSEHRNTAASAMSFGVPRAFSGVSSLSDCIVSSSKPFIMSVIITPGAMQFTRTPLSPTSFARAFVSPITPAFAAL